jgi:hypothetical protein
MYQVATFFGKGPVDFFPVAFFLYYLRLYSGVHKEQGKEEPFFHTVFFG